MNRIRSTKSFACHYSSSYDMRNKKDRGKWKDFAVTVSQHLNLVFTNCLRYRRVCCRTAQLCCYANGCMQQHRWKLPVFLCCRVFWRRADIKWITWLHRYEFCWSQKYRKILTKSIQTKWDCCFYIFQSSTPSSVSFKKKESFAQVWPEQTSVEEYLYKCVVITWDWQAQYSFGVIQLV